MRARCAATAAVVVALTALWSIRPAAALELPRISRILIRGGSNGILGFYLAGGLGFDLGGGTILTLGTSYTERLGVEPLVTLSYSRPIGSGWNLAALASHGDFGGDYRVERLPEVVLSRGGRIGASILHYSLDAGVAHFIVRPNQLSGIRGTIGASLSTSRIPLIPGLGLYGSTGYRQYAYSHGGPHSAWWGAIQLSVTAGSPFTTSFTYLRQMPAGTSPLLFDAMGAENYIEGAASLRVAPSVTLQHSQNYSFITRTIAARVYGASVSLAQGQSISVSYDDVAQKLSVSYSRPTIGSFGLSWDIPTRVLSFSFQR